MLTHDYYYLQFIINFDIKTITEKKPQEIYTDIMIEQNLEVFSTKLLVTIKRGWGTNRGGGGRGAGWYIM